MSAYVVTGGTSGIGLATARLLLERDREAQVFCLSRSSQEFEHARAGFEAAERLHFVECDVARADECIRAANCVALRAGALEGLVNAAGIIRAGDIDSTQDAHWSEVLRVNLDGPFHVCRAFLPMLRAGRGRAIVNVSSVCSIRPCDTLAYSVSKAGLDMLTRSMASTLAKEGLRVNAVNPGVVRSRLQVSAGIVEDYEDFLRARAAMHPLGRIGEPMDVATAIHFLLGAEAGWITGICLSVDGGRAAC